MANIPLSVAQYDKMIVMVDFIGAARKLIGLNEIKNYRFTPKLDGYELFAERDGQELNVRIFIHKSRFMKADKFSAVIKNAASGEITEKKIRTAKSEKAVEFAENLFEICGWQTKQEDE